jgi:hypothetical protein
MVGRDGAEILLGHCAHLFVSVILYPTGRGHAMLIETYP